MWSMIRRGGYPNGRYQTHRAHGGIGRMYPPQPQPPRPTSSLKIALIVGGAILGVGVLICAGIIGLGFIVGPTETTTTAATAGPTPAVTSASPSPSLTPTPSASPSPTPTTTKPTPSPSPKPAIKTVRMPNLVGLKLSLAMDISNNVGLTNITVCRTPGGDIPIIWSNWRVTGQDVDAGTRIKANKAICLDAVNVDDT